MRAASPRALGASPIRPVVLLIAAGAGLSSGIALLVTILSGAPLWMSSTFIFVPGFVSLVAVSVMLRRDEQSAFVARMRAGSVAGVLGTAAYDLVRWSVETTGLASTNTFKAIPLFGAGLTGRAPTEPSAIAAGWAFHACNGIGFALAYTFVAAGRPWWWAVGYALGLEAAMVALYPSWLGISLTREFLSVSILGHIAYGAVIGRFAERAR